MKSLYKPLALLVAGLGIVQLMLGALQDLGWLLAVVLSDIGGKKFNLRYAMTAADYTTAATDRTTLLSRLDAVTDCEIMSHSLTEKFGEDGDVFGTDEGENQAEIVAKLTAPLKTVNIFIPAPIAAMFVAASGPDYDVVDPTNVSLQAYLSSFEAAGLATTSDGETIRDSATAGNFTGKRIHKASRKG
jgi:hypothetical protein